MSLRIVAEHDAAAQMRTALLWWRENRPAAPQLLRDELREAIALLRRAPDAGKVYAAYRAGEVRRLLLPKTRYHLYYEHDAGDGVLTILALWSAVRGRKPPLKVKRR